MMCLHVAYVEDKLTQPDETRMDFVIYESCVNINLGPLRNAARRKLVRVMAHGQSLAASPEQRLVRWGWTEAAALALSFPKVATITALFLTPMQ